MPDASHPVPSAERSMRGSRPLGAWIALVAVALSVGAFALLSRFGGQFDPELVRRADGLKHVVVVGDAAGDAATELRLGASRVSMAMSVPEVDVALKGVVPEVLTRAMASANVDGLLVSFQPRSTGDNLRDKLVRYGHVRGLRADYLTDRWALLLPDPMQDVSPALEQALSTVARGVLGGQRAPRVTSFPEPLRRVQNVEVMILLRRDGRAVLWRSARASSIARALVTAAQTARRRWNEREQALGGPLDRQLPKLTVEVALLHEDGTLGARDATFVDSVFTPVHGVAFERRGSWHYLLPDATQRDGDGKASRAYAKLFSDNGLPETSLERQDVRLYRLVKLTLATSPPTDTGEDDPAHVGHPEDVLGQPQP